MTRGIEPKQPRGADIHNIAAESSSDSVSRQVSVPSGLAAGLQCGSYGEFIAAYARGGDLAPVKPFGALDQIAFQVQAERILGKDAPFWQVDSLTLEIEQRAKILEGLAPLCAYAASKLTGDGRLDPGPSGNKFTRTPKESRVAKRQALTKRIGASLRRRADRVGINGASEAFNPHSPGALTTTVRHRNNYVGNAGIAATKVLGNLASGGAVAGHVAQGVAELAAIAPLGWHAATIDAVLLTKLSSVEQAKYKVLINFAAAEAVLRSWMKGEQPDAQLGMQALEFWSGVAAWPDSAAVLAAQTSDWMAKSTAILNQADVRQVKTGWVRDVPGAIPLGFATVARGALYFLGDTALLGAAGPLALMAGLFHDVPQGLDERLWASLTKQQFGWRLEQLEKLEDEAAKDPRHAALLLTTMLYCARKKNIANTEMTIALTRVLSGFLRASGGTMSFAAMGPALGVGIAAGTAAAAGKAAVVVGGIALIAFQLAMAYRQHLRSKEGHAQKEGERSGEAVKATRDFEALCDSFMNGFTVTRGKGAFVSGDLGYSGSKETTYGDGGNEMLAWEVMAREIVDGIRDGEPPSFSMKMLLSLGLGLLDADQLEHGVLAKLHAGDEAGAVDAVERVIRGRLAAPPARATEALQPRVFKGVFEAAERGADLLAGVGEPPDNETIEAFLFNPRKDGGLAVDREAFRRSMKVLEQGFNKRGAKADVDGVYRRMLTFSQTLAPAKSEAAALRHLRTWTRVAERGHAADWTKTLNQSHRRIGQLLALATEQPDGPWPAQVMAALDARATSLQSWQRLKLNEVLLDDVHALQAAGMLAGQAGMIALALSKVLAPVGTVAVNG